MASGIPWGWIAGGVGVAGLWWLSSRSSSTASSSPRNAASAGASPVALPEKVPPLVYYSYVTDSTGVGLGPNSSKIESPSNAGPLTQAYQQWVAQFGGSPTHKAFANSTGGAFHEDWELDYVRDHYVQLPEKVTALWAEQEKLFGQRSMSMLQQKEKYPDFGPAPDKYSKAANLVFRPEHQIASSIMLAVPVSKTYTTKLVERSFQYRNWGWFVTDEFGRPYEGWGAGGGLDFLQVVSVVSNAVLPWIPGYGTAANVAIQATIAIAQGKSMKEVALAAARAALPAGAAFAFDLGVGIVLEHKSPKDAVMQAAVTELDKKYPGAKLAYEQGQSMAQQYVKNPNQNVNGLSFGGVFG